MKGIELNEQIRRGKCQPPFDVTIDDTSEVVLDDMGLPQYILELRRDDFDCRALERPAYKLLRHGVPAAGETEKIVGWLRKFIAATPQAYVIARLPSSEIRTSLLYQSAGCVVLETLLTFQRHVDRQPVAPRESPGLLLRRALDSDVPTCLRMIVGRTGSRFGTDPLLGLEVESRTMRAWIEGSVAGRGECYVGLQDGQTAGFVTWMPLGASAGQIGLIAVAEKAAGRGVGAVLLKRVVERCAEEGMRQLLVGTTASNLRATCYYLRHGFVIHDSQITLRLAAPSGSEC